MSHKALAKVTLTVTIFQLRCSSTWTLPAHAHSTFGWVAASTAEEDSADKGQSCYYCPQILPQLRLAETENARIWRIM